MSESFDVTLAVHGFAHLVSRMVLVLHHETEHTWFDEFFFFADRPKRIQLKRTRTVNDDSDAHAGL